MKHTITIEFEPGSDWQNEVQMNSLILMIEAWKASVEYAHKKNKVVIKKKEQK